MRTGCILPKRADVEVFLRADLGPDGMALLLLHFLRLGHWQAQAVRDILCEMVAADRKHHRMPYVAIDVDRQVGGATADIANRDAHLPFLLGQHDFRRGQRIQHEALNFHVRGCHALAQVINRGGGGRDDVRFHFQPGAVHAERSTDALLPIHAEAALDDVHDLTVMRNCDRTGLIEGAHHITHDRLTPPGTATAPRLLMDET